MRPQTPRKMINIASYGKGGDQFDTTEYDTFQMASGAGQLTRYEFFNHAIGTDGRTIQDTSMKQKGQFPKSNGLVATAIALHISTAKATPITATELIEIYKVLANSVLRVNVEGKDYLTQIPVAEMLPPVAVSTVDDAAGTTNSVALPTVVKIERKLAIAIMFSEQTQFSIDLDTGLNELPASCNEVRLKCLLKGVKQRGK
jgi:hypothetical protein